VIILFRCGGKGQALLVFLALDLRVGKNQMCLTERWHFYTDAQRFACMRSSGFKSTSLSV